MVQQELPIPTNPAPPEAEPPLTHHSDWLPLLLVTCFMLTIVVFTLSRYGNIKSQPWYVTVVCTIGWFFPFWIIFLLPLDLASVCLFSLKKGVEVNVVTKYVLLDYP